MAISDALLDRIRGEGSEGTEISALMLVSVLILHELGALTEGQILNLFDVAPLSVGETQFSLIFSMSETAFGRGNAQWHNWLVALQSLCIVTRATRGRPVSFTDLLTPAEMAAFLWTAAGGQP